VTSALLADAGATGRPAVRAWTPPRQVAFGRRDAWAEGYGRARAAARERGFPPIERHTGGRAVAYAGTTVAAVRTDPVGDGRRGIADRYDRAVAAVERALADLGAVVVRGEPPDTFCPGARSLSVAPDRSDRTWPATAVGGNDGGETPTDADGSRPVGGKLAGVAQRVRRGVALTAAVVVVREREAVADVLDPVYDALAVPFDPATVGSVRAAGGPPDPDRVARALEDALVVGRARDVERVG
jgi:lipoate-protein ligase A